ncbi:hypothetical protein EDB19DRAFT_1274303 [Suillus lakei]|nr:hypothetical protein EDB19DRAFT_1274303 [Suillus lakei]
MRSKAGFMSLAEELQFFILCFLPYRDILRCTSVCKALRQRYTSYSELQYIVELGGQQLLPGPDTDPDNHISIFQRLQLLRDRAHAWFELDFYPCATISIPKQFHCMRRSSRRVANGHLCLWRNRADSAMVFPILPKASQQTIKRDWSPSSLRSDPNAHIFDVFMDPAQNLIAVAYAITVDHLQSGNENFYFEIGALDGGDIYPQAAGQIFFLSELPGYEDSFIETDPNNIKLKGFGRHIAFWRTLHINDFNADIHDLWELQIWDWQCSATSSVSLSQKRSNYDDAADFCFLGHDRLLIFSGDIKLYSIEDISQAPQLLACFLMPISVMGIGRAEWILPMDDSPQPHMQAQQMMWTSDPKHQLLILSLHTYRSTLVFVISTRMFFNLDTAAEGMTRKIPWNGWGPSNSRAFSQHMQCRVGVSGNRVLQACPIDGTMDDDPSHATEYRLCAMDFSPLAVERRQGLGRVVKGPSTIEILDLQPEVTLTTNLPYVEVVLNRTFNYPFDGIWIDKDRIYLSHGYRTQLDVIEITPRAADPAKPTTSSDKYKTEVQKPKT